LTSIITNIFPDIDFLLNYFEKLQPGNMHHSNEGKRYSCNSRVPKLIYLTINEPQTLVHKQYRSTNILEAPYKPAILYEVFKTYLNLIKEEQRQWLQRTLKILTYPWWNIRRIQYGAYLSKMMDKGSKPVKERLLLLNQQRSNCIKKLHY
jgi:hypothetical protein